MLRCEYKTLPGEENSIRVEKIVMYSIFQYQPITHRQWSIKLYPGMNVKMSMAVVNAGTKDWSAFIILWPRFRKLNGRVKVEIEHCALHLVSGANFQ